MKPKLRCAHVSVAVSTFRYGPNSLSAGAACLVYAEQHHRADLSALLTVRAHRIEWHPLRYPEDYNADVATIESDLSRSLFKTSPILTIP